MLTNPGGILDPCDVVGRDDLVSEIWRALGRQSVILSAERRMGKTCVVKKMINAPHEGLVISRYLDLEDVHSPEEFARLAVQAVTSLLRPQDRVREWCAHNGAALAGLEIPKVKLPAGLLQRDWKDQLRHTFAAAASVRNATVVFTWDEFPQMVQNIGARGQGGPELACELLGLLREMRQTHEPIRMLLTGSIGFPLVLRQLRGARLADVLVNDLCTIGLGPLDLPSARDLARRLMEGEGLPCTHPETVADTVAHETGCVAFYVHTVVRRLCLNGTATVEGARAEVAGLLTSPDDPAHFRHFLERIQGPTDGPRYYTEEETPYALAALDAVAASSAPLAARALVDLTLAQPGCGDRELAFSVLTFLQRDHYLQLHDDGTYSFQLELLRRWWHLNRGLA